MGGGRGERGGGRAEGEGGGERLFGLDPEKRRIHLARQGGTKVDTDAPSLLQRLRPY